jgi:Heterokaryon incompatibility protein (HET)
MDPETHLEVDKIPYNPDKLLFEEPKELDAVSSRLKRPTQPGFRAQPVPLNDLLAGVVRNHRAKSRLWFRHSKLEEGRVRLVVVRPGHFDDALQLDLLSVSLERLPQYKALSYEWGDGPPIHSVILRDYIQHPKDIKDPKKRLQFLMFRTVGTSFFVRRNLFEALRHLRHEKDLVKLWIDDISINQADHEEKAEQITRMSEIYNRAYNVNVWLGTASESSDTAMDFIKELVQFEQLKLILHREESLSKWVALIDLMCSRWFSRRWVIQELALARTASVHCGHKVVHWDDFADAISIFTTKLSLVRSEIQKSNKELDFKPEALSMVEALGARTLVRAKSNLLQKGNDGKILEKNSTLEYLVSTLVSFDATDPRDTVYALLSISRENPQREL